MRNLTDPMEITPATFVCAVTVDTQAPTLENDAYLTTMDDYRPGA